MSEFTMNDLGTIEESILKRQTVKGMLSAVIKESGTHTSAEVQAEETDEGRSIDVEECLDISKGAGAGADVTASGIFADIIRAARV